MGTLRGPAAGAQLDLLVAAIRNHLDGLEDGGTDHEPDTAMPVAHVLSAENVSIELPFAASAQV